MLSDLLVIVLKPNKACLISCYFLIINEKQNEGNLNAILPHFPSFDQSDTCSVNYGVVSEP